MGKSKELMEDLRGRFAQVGKLFWSLHQFKQLYVPVSTTYLGVSPLPRAGRRQRLPPLNEKLVRMFRNSSATTNTQVCHELETARTPTSMSTLKSFTLLHRLTINLLDVPT